MRGGLGDAILVGFGAAVVLGDGVFPARVLRVERASTVDDVAAARSGSGAVLLVARFAAAFFAVVVRVPAVLTAVFVAAVLVVADFLAGPGVARGS